MAHRSSIATALLLLATLAACTNQRNPLPAAPAASSQVAAGLTAAPSGPYPRGQAPPATGPAEPGPELAILSPPRGELVTAASVDVVVRATDPDGVAGVTIAGVAARPGATPDAWVATVPLAPGAQALDVEAVDALGFRRRSYVVVVQGTFVPDDAVQEGALAVGLTPAGLATVARIAEDAARRLDLLALIQQKNPLLASSALTIEATGLRHLPLQLHVDGAPAGATITLTLEQVELDVLVDTAVSQGLQATVGADRATAVVQATVDRSAVSGAPALQRALGLRIDSIDVALSGFRVTTASSLVTTLLQPFLGPIESAVRRKLEDVLASCATSLLSRSLAGLDRPLVASIPIPLGTPVDVAVNLEVGAARGYAGAGLGLAAGVRAAATRPAPGTTPLVLATATRLPPAPIGPDPFTVQVTSGAVNALAHALWRTGGLGLSVDGTQPPPGMALVPSVRFLYPFFPPVRDLAPDPDTPVRIDLETAWAPVCTLGADPALPVGFAGEVVVRVSIDYMDGQPPLLFLELRSAGRVAADVQVTPTHLTVARLVASGVRVDVTAEPVVDVPDQQVEDFLLQLLPFLLDRYAQRIPPIKIPALPLGLQLGAPSLAVDPDVLTVRGTL